MASPKKSPAPPGRSTPRVSLSLSRSGGANPTDAIGNDLADIVARYRKTGQLPHVKVHTPLYGDFTLPDNLQDIREAMYTAEDDFNLLPSAIRQAAENDWVTFAKMFADPDQRKILETAGLNPKAVETPPQPPTKTVDSKPPPDEPTPPTDKPETS